MGIPDGTRLGPYEILWPIGAGGMGEVYRAYDVRLRRPVAIKTLPPSSSSDQTRLRLFHQEARALSSINHPNIVTLYALGDPVDAYYIVMEFVQGQTLRQALFGKRMTFRAVLDIGRQVASALCAAHSAGIVHCDIKPENIMIRQDGLIKVLDFGLAKLTAPDEVFPSLPANADFFNRTTLIIGDGCPSPSPYLTIPNAVSGDDIQQRVLGTATYMSPEHLCGQDVDARTDIFSLGVTLYELIAGVAPFGGKTRAETIDSILEREPPPLSWYRPEVPSALEHITSKALRKDRECRYQHTRDLLVDLQDVKQEREFEAALKREFEAALKRSAQHDFIKWQKAIPVPQSSGEVIHPGSIQDTLSGAAQAASNSGVILSEILNYMPGAEVTSALPARRQGGYPR